MRPPAELRGPALPGGMLWIAAALLLALRIPHLTGPLTDPHAWRQCDTVHFALDFYRRGLDLFHPAVCWLGAHRTIVLNFPLSEALTSLLYRIFAPDPMWDRIVALAFFVLSALWLWGIARRLAGGRAGALAMLAYLAFPLGQYFSRVPHIEFSVLAFVNGTLYYALRSCGERRLSLVVAAAACAALAAVIKGPYLGTIGIPLILILNAARTPGNALRLGLTLAVAAAAFLLWRSHVDTVNARVPDWYFLPDFYKEVNPLWRYTGTMAERLDPGNWIRIAKRLVYEVATPLGVLLALAALAPRGARTGSASAERGGTQPEARAVAIGWLAGCVVLVMVFFRLSVIHNYYQLPFLAPVAMLVGLGADVLWGLLPRVRTVPAAGALFLLFLGVATVAPRTLGYDRVDWLRIEAGKQIAGVIPEGDLVVASDFNTLPPTDPRLLFRAGREGWPMRAGEITLERVAKLETFGAKWVAVVTDPEHPAVRPPAFLASAEVAALPVTHDGRRLGTAHVFDLRRLAAPTVPPPTSETAPAHSDRGARR